MMGLVSDTDQEKVVQWTEVKLEGRENGEKNIHHDSKQLTTVVDSIQHNFFLINKLLNKTVQLIKNLFSQIIKIL